MMRFILIMLSVHEYSYASQITKKEKQEAIGALMKQKHTIAIKYFKMLTDYQKNYCLFKPDVAKIINDIDAKLNDYDCRVLPILMAAYSDSIDVDIAYKAMPPIEFFETLDNRIAELQSLISSMILQSPL